MQQLWGLRFGRLGRPKRYKPADAVPRSPMPTRCGACRWFRPGHGWFTSSMLALVEAMGLRMALGNVFPHDPWVSVQ